MILVSAIEGQGMKKFLLILIVFTLWGPVSARPTQEDMVANVLNDFHDAASKADGDRYFGHFTSDGIFLGTDITERWTVEEFKAYAAPHFSKGKGWTYHPESRNVYLSKDMKTAWFDEILSNKNYGRTRGTGVLTKIDDQWKIAQYHLTLPVPNELMGKVVEMIGNEAKKP